jgi:2-polyprenyl-3-methyl-5-hydroxy-6-metoxy-1,4-benzoquinol methylase
LLLSTDPPKAIAKAHGSFPDIDFRHVYVHEGSNLGQSFDLVVVMAVFTFVQDWPAVVALLAGRCLYVAEYIP